MSYCPVEKIECEHYHDNDKHCHAIEKIQLLRIGGAIDIEVCPWPSKQKKLPTKAAKVAKVMDCLISHKNYDLTSSEIKAMVEFDFAEDAWEWWCKQQRGPREGIYTNICKGVAMDALLSAGLKSKVPIEELNIPPPLCPYNIVEIMEKINEIIRYLKCAK